MSENEKQGFDLSNIKEDVNINLVVVDYNNMINQYLVKEKIEVLTALDNHKSAIVLKPGKSKEVVSFDKINKEAKNVEQFTEDVFLKLKNIKDYDVFGRFMASVFRVYDKEKIAQIYQKNREVKNWPCAIKLTEKPAEIDSRTETSHTFDFDMESLFLPDESVVHNPV